ncbi:MAG: hypothetical protein VXY77_00170 [Pseudomonadota bacterium]|nr:hypothetical protein [Pseudomonadota bacterium]
MSVKSAALQSFDRVKQIVMNQKQIQQFTTRCNHLWQDASTMACLKWPGVKPQSSSRSGVLISHKASLGRFNKIVNIIGQVLLGVVAIAMIIPVLMIYVCRGLLRINLVVTSLDRLGSTRLGVYIKSGIKRMTSAKVSSLTKQAILDKGIQPSIASKKGSSNAVEKLSDMQSSPTPSVPKITAELEAVKSPEVVAQPAGAAEPEAVKISEEVAQPGAAATEAVKISEVLAQPSAAATEAVESPEEVAQPGAAETEAVENPEEVAQPSTEATEAVENPEVVAQPSTEATEAVESPEVVAQPSAAGTEVVESPEVVAQPGAAEPEAVKISEEVAQRAAAATKIQAAHRGKLNRAKAAANSDESEPEAVKSPEIKGSHAVEDSNNHIAHSVAEQEPPTNIIDLAIGNSSRMGIWSEKKRGSRGPQIRTLKTP